MNQTKAAAWLSLVVSIAGAAYFSYVLYQNTILLRSSLDAWKGVADNSSIVYAVSGGVSVLFLILALAFFGMAKIVDKAQ